MASMRHIRLSLSLRLWLISIWVPTRNLKSPTTRSRLPISITAIRQMDHRKETLKTLGPHRRLISAGVRHVFKVKMAGTLRARESLLEAYQEAALSRLTMCYLLQVPMLLRPLTLFNFSRVTSLPTLKTMVAVIIKICPVLSIPASTAMEKLT